MGKLIVLRGNCGFENSLPLREKDEGSCTKDGMTCCKRNTEGETWGGRQMDKKIEKTPTPPPPPPHSSGSGGLIG